MQYVRNCWYVAGWAHDLEPEIPQAVSILGEQIVVWRTAEGKVFALANRCPHRLAPLSLGRCEGENLRCMYHGFLVNNSGATIEIPGQDKIPPQAQTRRYPIMEKDSWLWVWMGDEADADTSLIPDAFGYDDERFLLGGAYLDYEAEASLINDNLLDFSHLTYVHANSFGAGSSFSDGLPNIKMLERGVRISRWVENAPGPGGSASRPLDLIDFWSSYDYVLPGILVMHSGSFPQGSAKKFGPAGPPDMSLAVRDWAVSCQAVTPTAPGKARYFFSTGPHRDYGDDAAREAMVALAHMAFAEDKTMIEAQYKVIQGIANPRFIPSAHDRAVTMFNALVRKLVTAEDHSQKDRAG